MTRHDLRAICILLAPGLSACSQPADEGEAVNPTAIVALPDQMGAASKSFPRLKVAPIKADERRVMIFVLPGDASVEIDGRLTFRRHGVVEIVGRIGDEHKLRAFKGKRSTEEKSVILRETGASVSFVNLDEVSPTANSADPEKKVAPPPADDYE
jgi:hypothetical protein